MHHTNAIGRSAKARAIAESIINSAQALQTQMAKAYPKRRKIAFRKKYSGERKRRQAARAAKAMVPLTAFMGAIQLATIISQPVRKSPGCSDNVVNTGIPPCLPDYR